MGPLAPVSQTRFQAGVDIGLSLEAERPGVAPLKKALGVARGLLAGLDEFRDDAASPNGRDGRRSQNSSLIAQVTPL